MILLTPDRLVEDIHAAAELSGLQFASWLGSDMHELVTPDSKEKLRELLEANCAVPDGESRWRHINCNIGEEQSLPLLAKHFRFLADDGKEVSLICARDLSPMADAQRSFAMTLAELNRLSG